MRNPPPLYTGNALGLRPWVLDVYFFPAALLRQALFRRGVARARLGALEDANSDLLAVIKADPRNGGAKKELKVR